MKVMKLTPGIARDIIFSDHPDWECASENIIDDTSRWSIHVSQVFLHTPSGKYFEFNWSQGSTEMQDERPFEDDDEVEVFEVEEKEVTVKQWVSVK